MAASTPYDIVILGGNFGGGGVAHYLLKHTLPALAALAPSTSYRVTIVSQSAYYYSKPAAPRVLVQPEVLTATTETPDRVPLTEIFAQYPAEQVSIVHGTATSIDPAARTVAVTKADGATTSQRYDSLVLATGTTPLSPLWTLDPAAHRALVAALPHAQTILIAGGGPVGVESAGELAQHYPSANITLLSGGARVLHLLSEKTSRKAEGLLTGAGVKVVHGVKVTESKTVDGAADEEDVSTARTVTLSNGETKTVDLYLNATGGIVNTGYLPKAWLDERGKVRETDFRVAAADAGGRVYAVGDVAASSQGGIFDIMAGVRPTARAVGLDIAQKAIAEGKARTKEASDKAFEPAPFKPMRLSQIVPVGSKGGAGQLMGWSLPSWAVWLIKSRHFFIPDVKKRAHGSEYVKV